MVYACMGNHRLYDIGFGKFGCARFVSEIFAVATLPALLLDTRLGTGRCLSRQMSIGQFRKAVESDLLQPYVIIVPITAP